MPGIGAPTFWRVTILVGTIFCVVMLFAPLVREMLTRLTEVWNTIP